MHGLDEDVYIGFECKRLNLPANGGRKSLAREYVEEGMMRFVTGKYAEGLAKGGMIGFVMDGDIATATLRVGEEIRSRVRPLRMAHSTGLTDSSFFPAAPTVRETKHPHRSPALILHHLFLEV